MFGRRQVAITVAEFIGTGLLALVILTVQHTSIGFPYFVAIAAGLTLAAATATFGLSGDGAHFNPAVTIGMWTTRQIKTLPAAVYVVAQMLGGWAAYYMYTYFTRTSLQPVGGHYDGHILVAEALGAFVLTLAYGAAVFHGYVNSKTAVLVGAAYTAGIIIASSASLGLANPAVALSVRAFDVLGSMGWGTYVLGPVLGSVIGFNLYALLFAPETSFAHMRSLVIGKVGRATAAPAAKEEKVVAPKAASSRSTARRTATRSRTNRRSSRSRR